MNNNNIDNNERILITGASGFLGVYLVKQLSRLYSNIVLLSYHKNDSASYENIDITDLSPLRKKIEQYKPTLIYHLGGFVNLSRDFETGKKCFDVNLLGTYNLLESLRSYPPKKVIFTSTEEIYGNNPIPFIENQLPDPPSPYAVSKIAAENLCQIYAKDLGFNLFILRLATFYGPKQPSQRFISQIITKALNNEDIPLNSGLKKRDYIYVEDVADACILSTKAHFNSSNPVINIGGGKSFSLIYLVNKIIQFTESTSKVLIGKIPERALEADEWLLDINRAKELLDWEPVTDLDDGLRLTIDYYKKNVKI